MRVSGIVWACAFAALVASAEFEVGDSYQLGRVAALNAQMYDMLQYLSPIYNNDLPEIIDQLQAATTIGRDNQDLLVEINQYSGEISANTGQINLFGQEIFGILANSGGMSDTLDSVDDKLDALFEIRDAVKDGVQLDTEALEYQITSLNHAFQGWDEQFFTLVLGQGDAYSYDDYLTYRAAQDSMQAMSILNMFFDQTATDNQGAYDWHNGSLWAMMCKQFGDPDLTHPEPDVVLPETETAPDWSDPADQHTTKITDYADKVKENASAAVDVYGDEARGLFNRIRAVYTDLKGILSRFGLAGSSSCDFPCIVLGAGFPPALSVGSISLNASSYGQGCRAACKAVYWVVSLFACLAIIRLCAKEVFDEMKPINS